MTVQTFCADLPEGQQGPWSRLCTYLINGFIEETGQPTFGCLASFIQVGEQFEKGRCQLCPAAQGIEEEIAQRAKYFKEHGHLPSAKG